MSNGLQMAKKKSKRLASQNSSKTSDHLQGSIEKYCTEKNIKKHKIVRDKIRKKGYLRNKRSKHLICIPQNGSDNKNNDIKTPLSSFQNDITLYEIKPLSPTKLTISVKKFYNNNKFKEFEENLHLHNKNELYISKRMTLDNKCEGQLSKNEKSESILSNEKTCNIVNKKCKKVKKYFKPHDLVPQLNKDKCKKIKSVKLLSNECNSGNEVHLNTLQTSITNETQTNECPVEEYQVTRSTIDSLSISVKRFYRSNIPSRTSDNEKANKDMPLISDTAFNSKADFSQSPSSKLNNSHKISLNVQHIKDTTHNKQQKVTAFFPIRRSARKTKNTVNEEKQKALEKAIISQNEDGLKIAVFPKKGRGIIAGREFARGEFVVEYAGELVSLHEARKREVIYSKDSTAGCYMYYFKYGTIHYCIDATAESSRLGRLVNHSRFGNLGPKAIEVSGVPRVVLIAKTDIKQGEELTYDYGDRSKKSLINHPWLAY